MVLILLLGFLSGLLQTLECPPETSLTRPLWGLGVMKHIKIYHPFVDFTLNNIKKIIPFTAIK